MRFLSYAYANFDYSDKYWDYSDYMTSILT